MAIGEKGKIMRAWILERFGEIRFGDFELSELSEGEVLVRVLACGVCYRDIIDIQGGFRNTRLPTVPGHEICGVVERVKGRVSLSEGDLVVTRHGGFCGRCEFCLSGNDNLCFSSDRFVHTVPGGYAEFVRANFSAFEKVPAGIDLSPEELSLTFCAIGTAYRAVVTQAEAKAGDTVLVTGASGGVGVHAVQIAKSAGCNVIAVTSSKDKVKRLRELGADEVILSEDMRFNESVVQITGGRGVDIVIENTGSLGLEGAIRSLKPTGVLVAIGNIKVDRYPLNPGMIITREIKIKGTIGISHNELENLFSLMKAGRVKPIVSARFALEDVPKAHDMLKSKGVFGRTVISVGRL